MHRLGGLAKLLAHPTPDHALVLLGLAAALVAGGYLLARSHPATLFSVGTGLEVFSGSWKHMHLPLPLDRVVFLAGLLSLAVGGWRRRSARRLVVSPIHLLFALLVGAVVVSALAAGTLATSVGFYALLDRLGVLPFAMFTLAALVYRTEEARRTLVVVLVVTGIYLGVTACAEGVGLTRLVFPRYISDPTLGIHFGRARGPFLESVADGLSMVMCAIAATVGLTMWRGRLGRVASAACVLLCGAGTLFTLTRSVWVAGAVAVAVPMAWDRRLRRALVPTALAGAVAVAVALAAVPGLHHKVTSRVGELSPVWDRYNTNDAAVRAWLEHPLFGIGWQTFTVKGPSYLREAATYPLTGVGLEVHNVFLSHLVELGAPLAALWTLALVSGVGGAALRRGPAELYPWRLGLMAMLVAFVVTADLGPLSYPMPNLLLWMWAGIVAADRYSVDGSEDPVLLAEAVLAGAGRTRRLVPG